MPGAARISHRCDLRPARPAPLPAVESRRTKCLQICVSRHGAYRDRTGDLRPANPSDYPTAHDSDRQIRPSRRTSPDTVRQRCARTALAPPMPRRATLERRGARRPCRFCGRRGIEPVSDLLTGACRSHCYSWLPPARRAVWQMCVADRLTRRRRQQDVRCLTARRGSSRRVARSTWRAGSVCGGYPPMHPRRRLPPWRPARLAAS